MLPFTVSAWTKAATDAGSSTVIPPLTVLNDSGPRPSARPMEARIEPFTVSARASPPALTRTLPFTV